MLTFRSNAHRATVFTAISESAVAASSGKFYGRATLGMPYPKLYICVKWASMHLRACFIPLSVAGRHSARIRDFYGPAEWHLRKIVPYVILSLLRGEAPQVTSGARQDGRSMWKMSLRHCLPQLGAGVEGRTIDIGSGELVSIRALVDASYL